MKAINFDRVEDFFSLKEECPFCHSKLKLMLTNFLAMEGDIPIIKSYLDKDNWFRFNFRHVTENHDINLAVGLDVKNNNFHFLCQKTAHIEYYISTFEGITPHLELYCPNKRNCKMKYYIASHGLKSNRYTDISVLAKNKATYPAVVYSIEPIKLYCESFSIDKYWVQNDYFYNCTYIHLRNKPSIDPFKTQLITLDSMDGNHLLARIKMLVTFS